MSESGKVTTPVLIAAGLNLAFDYRNESGKNATRIIFGNVALFASLTAIGQFVDWDIAAMLAVLYLMHTLLTDGVEVINWTTELTKNM
jgi:hypothetical protein